MTTSSLHQAVVRWQRGVHSPQRGRFSRVHVWEFDGGVSVPASAAPAYVPAPLSSAAAVDPEEAVVAALASCHMLWFLHLAEACGFAVAHYEDHPEGRLGPDEEGASWLTEVVLRPEVQFLDDRPDEALLAQLHGLAHESCHVARSLRSRVTIASRGRGAAPIGGT